MHNILLYLHYCMALCIWTRYHDKYRNDIVVNLQLQYFNINYFTSKLIGDSFILNCSSTFIHFSRRIMTLYEYTWHIK